MLYRSAGCTFYELICLEAFYDMPNNIYNDLSRIDSNLNFSYSLEQTSNLVKELLKR